MEVLAARGEGDFVLVAKQHAKNLRKDMSTNVVVFKNVQFSQVVAKT
jgi:hypothetical protein